MDVTQVIDRDMPRNPRSWLDVMEKCPNHQVAFSKSQYIVIRYSQNMKYKPT
jgi:ribosomal protein S27E